MDGKERPHLVTGQEMADLLRVNYNTSRDLARRRNLPRWKIGRLVRYDPDEIPALLRVDER